MYTIMSSVHKNILIYDFTICIPLISFLSQFLRVLHGFLSRLLHCWEWEWMGKEVFTENFYVPLSQMWFFNHWYHYESSFLVLTVSGRPQHHLWSQYRPQTSTWPFLAAWTADIMRTLDSTQANDITSNMALRATCFMDNQYEPWWQPIP